MAGAQPPASRLFFLPKQKNKINCLRNKGYRTIEFLLKNGNIFPKNKTLNLSYRRNISQTCFQRSNVPPCIRGPELKIPAGRNAPAALPLALDSPMAVEEPA